MHIIRAKTAGFCMGVSLALNKLEQTMSEHIPDSSPLIMLGPIIHNPQVLAKYTAQGVMCVDSVYDVPPQSTVIIRAHGLPTQDEAYLRNLEVTIIDATCPKVKKAQLAIAQTTANHIPLLLFGEHDHPEVRGLISYAAGPYRVFSDSETVSLENYTQCVVLAAQTTQDNERFRQLAQRLHKQCSKLIILSTICNATSHRQREAIQIAKQVDMMLVVGGYTSGNTRRLADVTQTAGTPTRHIENLEELMANPLPPGVNKLGLTAGASTPKDVIDTIENHLRKH